jgi:hypothetical protein
MKNKNIAGTLLALILSFGSFYAIAADYPTVGLTLDDKNIIAKAISKKSYLPLKNGAIFNTSSIASRIDILFGQDLNESFKQQALLELPATYEAVDEVVQNTAKYFYRWKNNKSSKIANGQDSKSFYGYDIREPKPFVDRSFLAKKLESSTITTDKYIVTASIGESDKTPKSELEYPIRIVDLKFSIDGDKKLDDWMILGIKLKFYRDTDSGQKPVIANNGYGVIMVMIPPYQELAKAGNEKSAAEMASKNAKILDIKL